MAIRSLIIVTLTYDIIIIRLSAWDTREKRENVKLPIWLSDEITKWVDVIYLDFQKAFDKVTQQGLILKLKSNMVWETI